MSDTFPPPQLPPESTPWARAIQVAVVAVDQSAALLGTNLSNLEKVQIAQDLLLSERITGNSRDIVGVNTELSRVYREVSGRLDGHDTEIASLKGRMDSAFEYLTQFSALLGNHGPRIGNLENKLNLATASSINGMEFVAVSGGTWYKVPQSVGSPLGGPIKWPFSLVYASDRWGPRVSPGGIGSTFHRAVDFYHPSLDIRAAGRGTVIFAGDNGGLGNHIEVRHSPTLVTGYSHLSSIGVSVGQAVSQGQSIGIMGTTGTSTGVHLHFATTVNGVLVNPETLITGDDYL